MLRTFLRAIPLALLLCVALANVARAQTSEDFEQYHLRIDADWLYNFPSGTLKASGDVVPVDLNQDLGFQHFSTFSGKVDWKFTRKNHLYIEFIPISLTQQTTLQRSIVFQGQTFTAGVAAQAELTSNTVAPGYQYDLVRRKWGHFGLGLQMDFIDVKATVSVQAQVTGSGVRQAAASATASQLAPIPVAGPEFRVYLAPRLFLDGDLKGMYFFGYGSFISTSETLGVALTRHFALRAGYRLGSRLIVNDKAERLGVRMTQQGATAGLSLSF
jgi:hypothetical protein